MLRHVADVRRGAAHRGGRLEAVGRAGGARTGATLGRVAGAGRGAAHGAGRCEAVGRAAVGDAVAGLLLGQERRFIPVESTPVG